MEFEVLRFQARGFFRVCRVLDGLGLSVHVGLRRSMGE